MVNKHRNKGYQNEPPAADEAWWESVLAEDQFDFPQKSAKNGSEPMHKKQPSATSVVKRASEIPTMSRSSPKSSKNAPEFFQTISNQTTIDWEKARKLLEQDQVVELQVVGWNRGGLLVSGDGLQGFVPLSHLVEAPIQENIPEHWLKAYINRYLYLKIIECDQGRGRIVFSERAAQSQPGSRIRLLNQLRPGDCVDGVITNITEFGAFVDLGGVEGLVHVSEISWGRVQYPAELLQLGQKVGVYVIQVDKERGRVALSMKRLRPNPWETAESRYFPGQITEAVVTSIVPFGVFARLEEGLDGLIHISEMPVGNDCANPQELLKEGQRILVRILHVDASKQRLGLSLRLERDEVPGKASPEAMGLADKMIKL